MNLCVILRLFWGCCVYFFLPAAFSAFFSAFRISFSRSLRSFSCCRFSFSMMCFRSFSLRLNLDLSSPVTPNILRSRESSCSRAPPSTPCSRNLEMCSSRPSASSHWQTYKQQYRNMIYINGRLNEP